MEEINFREMFSYLIRKLWLVLAITVLVFGAGEFYTVYMKTPLYKSSTDLVLISDNSSSNTQLTYNDVTLSNNLVKTYSEIVKSRNVLEKVIKNQNLSESVDALSGKITVSSVTSTQLITVTVSDPDPARAEAIANEIGTVFKKEIKSIYGIDNVQIVDKAVAANTPYNINVIKESLIYLVAGLALGIGAALLIYVLDNTIKDTDTVEDKLGLTIIGVVPAVEGK